MDFIKFEATDHIGIVTLDRPRQNAFNYQMYKELKDTFELINRSQDIWTVIIRAEGKYFSAGNDVTDFQAGVINVSMEDYGNMVETGLGSVVNCKVPVISAVQGVAVGSGFCIPTYSDIVIATPEAKFGITEIKVGIIGGAPEASFSLPPKIVRYMALTGNLITAEEMEQYSFVLKIVSRDDLLDTALGIAQSIVSNPPIALKYMKESLNNIYRPDIIAKKIEFDGEKTGLHMQTEDFTEAIAAFMEKRKPVYHVK
ncbi:enoyl-CoA hydratase/isomerase family protein [bacterium]|nr:enoyl-CoA hydratase/isomerase family protein [bacterium]